MSSFNAVIYKAYANENWNFSTLEVRSNLIKRTHDNVVRLTSLWTHSELLEEHSKFAAEIAVLFQELRACSQARVYVFNKGSHFP